MINTLKTALNTLATAGLAVSLTTGAAQAGPIDRLAQEPVGQLVCYNQEKTFCAENMRNNDASAGDFETAADHSFKKRVAILVHGGDKNLLKAAFEAANALSKQGQETRFVMLPDNDGDSEDAMIKIYQNGAIAFEHVWKNPQSADDYKALALIVFRDAMKASEVIKAANESETRELSALTLEN